jgi:hypothetical protein
MMQQTMPGMSPGGMGYLQPGMGMQNQGWPMQLLDGSMPMDTSSPDDNWSNSSRSGGPIAPQTLNVEDWYVNYYQF